MQDISLQQAMNRVSMGLDRAGPAPMAAPLNPQPDLREELDLFADMDPLLSDLQKQYLDAKAVRRKQVQAFGANDPMAEIAADMEDSAWCAMQTRYIELRGERLLMARVQKEMRVERRQREYLLKREKERKALLFFQQMQLLRRIKDKGREKKKSVENFLLAFVLLGLGPMNRPSSTYGFSV